MSADAASGSPIRALVFFTVSMLSGTMLVAVLFQLLTGYQQQIEEAKRPEDTVMAIVAARDLYPGVAIAEDDLYAIEIAPRYLPDGSFLSPDHVIGRVPRERVLANELVRAGRLADPEAGVGLNAVIPRGMRAFSMNVDGGQALAGLLMPASYVDVLATIPDPSSAGASTTRTLVQAVFVLGVNGRMQKETAEEARGRRGATAPSVTLLVTAEQAEDLAHAQSLGAMTLTLGSDADVNQAYVSAGVDLVTLRDAVMGPRRVEEVRARPVKPRPAPVAPPQGEGTLIIIGPDSYRNPPAAPAE